MRHVSIYSSSPFQVRYIEELRNDANDCAWSLADAVRDLRTLKLADPDQADTVIDVVGDLRRGAALLDEAAELLSDMLSRAALS